MTHPALDDIEFRLILLQDHLQRAAAGEDVASNISEALYRVDCHGPRAISAPQAQALRFAAANAAVKACDKFPGWVPREHIRRGFNALLAWIDRAALPPAERPDDVESLDRRSRLRILRNAAHNVALDEQIAERSEARWTSIIAELAEAAR